MEIIDLSSKTRLNIIRIVCIIDTLDRLGSDNEYEHQFLQLFSLSDFHYNSFNGYISYLRIAKDINSLILKTDMSRFKLETALEKMLQNMIANNSNDIIEKSDELRDEVINHESHYELLKRYHDFYK